MPLPASLSFSLEINTKKTKNASCQVTEKRKKASCPSWRISHAGRLTGTVLQNTDIGESKKIPKNLNKHLPIENFTIAMILHFSL